MSFRSHSRVLVTIIGLTTLAGSAQATFYSFASDNTHTMPTFLGTKATGTGVGSTFQISSPVGNTFSLLVDDNNGPLPAFSVATSVVSNLTATFAVASGFGTFQTYNYLISGNVDFVDPTTKVLLLRISIGTGAGAAVMTVPGSATQWGSAGGIIGSDSFSQIDYILSNAGYAAFSTAAGGNAALLNYGIAGSGTSQGPALDDFGFTLTALRQAASVVSVPVDGGAPTADWQSESSYSGSSGTIGIPAPGAASLLGLAGLLGARRRRA